MRLGGIVLLSGGLDSTTVLAVAQREGLDVEALTIDYGQRHRFELDRAAAIARRAGVRQTVLPIDLARFGGSALTDDIEVPKPGPGGSIGEGIPVTYVPGRNLVFLSLAVALAESRGCSDVFIGVNAVDYSGYPDCRPEFIESFERTASLATKRGVGGTAVRVRTPLSGLSKAEIVRLGMRTGAPLELTTSCYDPGPTGEPCGQCEACVLRARGFAEAGEADPALHQAAGDGPYREERP